MAFPYKHVVLIGATSGIGKAMAEKLVNSGSKVTVVGRRKERLDEFVAQHGESKAKAVQFDIGKTAEASQFAAGIMKASPDVDCIFLNAGTQHRCDFSQPEKLDLAKFNDEININFTAFVALTHAFLPYLIAKKSPTSLIFTTSTIDIIPASMLPAYSASKAALNAFILCIRDHLRHSNVKVIDLLPPPVQTEMHDEEMGPEAGRKFGMPVDQFTEIAFKELVAGKDEVVIGTVGTFPREELLDIMARRRAGFDTLAKLMRGGEP